MKAFLIPLVLLLCISTAHAQDWSQLPELPVWYELENTSFGKNMYYFPNFDTARGGFNVLSHYLSGKNLTWYNRYKGDTVNMHIWPYAFYKMMQGDFNGDGIQDYFGGSGEVYLGVKYGEPPHNQPIFTKISSNMGMYTEDFDIDGKSDVLVRDYSSPTKEKQLGSIIFGNSDLTKMQVVALPHTTDTTFLQECILDAYTNNGKARMITMTWDENRSNSSLHLWEIRFITSGTKVKVEYQKLASQFLSNENSESFLIGIKTFHLFSNSQHSLLFIATLYNLDNDKFEKLWFRSQGSPEFKIPVSIPDLNMPGWFTISINAKFNLCFGGNPRLNPAPIAKLPDNVMLSNGSGTRLLGVSSIGDVNHDGFGDIAAYYSGIDGNYFRIYLGTVGTVEVNDQPENTRKKHISISLRNTIVTKGSALDIHTTVEQSGTYSIDIYSMDGKKVTTLWNGELQQGETDITLQPMLQALATGRYNIMIDNGTQFNVCGILIQ